MFIQVVIYLQQPTQCQYLTKERRDWTLFSAKMAMLTSGKVEQWRSDKVKVKSKADEAIRASLELARENLGGTITTDGSQAFRQKTWLVGSSMNMEIQGYQPTQEGIEELERITGLNAHSQAKKEEVEVYDYKNSQEDQHALAMR